MFNSDILVLTNQKSEKSIVLFGFLFNRVAQNQRGLSIRVQLCNGLIFAIKELFGEQRVSHPNDMTRVHGGTNGT